MIWGNLQKNKKYLATIFAVIFVFGFMFSVEATEVFAQETLKDKAINYVAGEFVDSSFAMKLLQTTAEMWLSGTSWALWLSGLILNLVTIVTIDNMSVFVKGTSGISESWEVLRDIVNISFIFGILVIAIMTIIQGTGALKKTLSGIIIAALLINFSFFFTALAIDVSNIVTLQFKQALSCDTDLTGAGTRDLADGGLSNCFMSALKLQGVYNISPDGNIGSVEQTSSLNDNSTTSEIINFIIGMFMGGVFILIAAIVFFVIAIMLIQRFLTFIFLLITSPAMFVGLVFPKLQSVSSGWLKKLIAEALFAPVLFLFIYISLKIASSGNLLQSSGISVGAGSFSTAFQGVSSSIGVILNYLIIIGFLVGSLIMAKKVGGSGASGASDWGVKAAGGLTGKMVFGTSARLGRATVGRAANYAAEHGVMKNIAARTPLGLGKAIQGGFKKTASASFDARATPISAALEANNIKLGDAKKGGYAKVLKDQIKGREDTYKELGELTTKERGILLKHNEEIHKLSADIEKAKKEIGDAEANLNFMESQGVSKNNPAYISAQDEIKNKKTNIQKNESSLIIAKSNRDNSSEYKAAKKSGDDRQNDYLKRISGQYKDSSGAWVENVPFYKAWVGRKNSDVVLKIREKSAKKETDVDKIIKGLKKKEKEGESDDDKKEEE